MGAEKIHLDRYNNLNKKINVIIEWILNEHPLLNKQYKDKLEGMLIGNLKYYKDSHGNTLRIEVIN